MRARPTGDSGETLLELLIALVIMSIAVVAVVGGLLSFITVSDIHRKQATAGAGVRDYAEATEKYVAVTGYSACATPASYAAVTVGYLAPAGYSASPVTVRYWTGSAWTATCTAGSDTGLQQVSLQVASTDTRAIEQAVIVLRNPCGTATTCSS